MVRTLHASWDLVAAMLAASTAIGLACFGVSDLVVRSMVGLPLVLALPGYALTTVAFGRGVLRAEERLMYSLGLSLAVAALGGLLLNWTPTGLEARSWAVLLGGIALVASGVAIVRRSGPPASTWAPRRPDVLPREALLVGLAGLVVVAALMLARSGAGQPSGQGFTELWALPANPAGPARIGIANRELGVMQYRLLLVDGDGRLLREWPILQLGVDEQWHSTFALPSDPDAPAVIQVLLYRVDAPDDVYRQVLLRPERGTDG